MADGKDIEIKLKATGGDAAAKEVEAVGDALSATAQAAEMFAGVDTSDVAGAQAAAFADEAKQLADLEQAYNDAAVAEAELTVKKQERAAKDEAFYAARAKETEAARAAYVASEKAAEVMRAEANAARELAKAQEELAKAQAKPPVEMTPLFEWGPEVGSTAAAKQHAAAVEAMGKAYEKAATEAAELAQAQEETAKEEAAEAAEEQSDALGKLGSSVANLIPGYGAMKEKVTKVREAWALASAGGATFGQRLLALAGGPVGIATAAVAGLVAVFVNYRAKMAAIDATLDEVGARIDANSEAAMKNRDALAEAGTAARDYAGELGTLTTETEAALSAWEESERRILALADAQDALKRATIDARVASGEITAAQGAVEKGDIEIESAQKKADAAVKGAEQRKAVADAEARRAADAEKQATDDLAKAEAAQAEKQKRIEQAQREVVTKKLQGDAVKSSTPEEIVGILGVEDTKARLRAMDGFMGGLARTQLDAGASPENVIGKFERAAIAQQLADEAKAEQEALDETSSESIEKSKAIVEERQGQLDAVKKIRENAEKEARESADGVDKAKFDKRIVDDYTVPEVETRNETIKKKEEARLAKEESDRLATENRAGIDTDAKTIAGEIKSKIAGANAAENPALVESLKQIVALLGNGTDSAELTGITGQLITLASGLSAEQSASRAVIEKLQSQVAALAAREANNPSR